MVGIIKGTVNSGGLGRGPGPAINIFATVTMQNQWPSGNSPTTGAPTTITKDNVMNYVDYHAAGCGILGQGHRAETQNYTNQQIMTEAHRYQQLRTEVIGQPYQHGIDMRTVQQLAPETEMRTVQQFVPEIEYVQMQIQVPQIEYVPVQVSTQHYIPEPLPERRARSVVVERRERTQPPPEKVMNLLLN